MYIYYNYYNGMCKNSKHTEDYDIIIKCTIPVLVTDQQEPNNILPKHIHYHHH